MLTNVNQSFHEITTVTHRKSRTTILDPAEDGPVLPRGSLLDLVAPNYDTFFALLGDNDVMHEGI